MKNGKQLKKAAGRLGVVWVTVTGLLFSFAYLPVRGTASEACRERDDREVSGQILLNTENPELAPTELYSKAAVLMDARTGRVLYEKDGSEKLSNASTTKIMTCILVLEQECDDQIMETSAYAGAQPKVHLGVRSGQQFLVKDLLYSLMLESHNDAAVILAESIGAKALGLSDTAGERNVEESKQAVAAFARMMNEKAMEIGCKDTTFVTPNGLDAVQVAENENGEETVLTHGTTATDLAKIMAYCVTSSPKKEEFLKITRTVDHSFSDVEGRQFYTCHNHNAFLGMMDGALSGKTGFTNSAGYCYVGALQRDDRIYTIALLACGWPNHKGWKWQDSRKLYNYGLENYVYQEFLPEVEVSPLAVSGGQPKDGNPYHSVEILPVLEEAEPMRILCREGEHMVAELECLDHLEAPVDAGTQTGTVTYYFVTAQGERIPWKSVSVRVQETVAGIDAEFVTKYVTRNFLLGPNRE